MVELPCYQTGDLVAWTGGFEKLGQVISPMESGASGRCTVKCGDGLMDYPEGELLLVSIRNNANFRLLTLKLDDALGAERTDSAFRHELVTFARSGSLVARAFADYATKIPQPILQDVVVRLAQSSAPTIESAVEQVLGLNFALIVGRN